MESYYRVVSDLEREVSPLLSISDREFVAPLAQEPPSFAAELLDMAADSGAVVSATLLTDVEAILLPDADEYDTKMIVSAISRLRDPV